MCKKPDIKDLELTADQARELSQKHREEKSASFVAFVTVWTDYLIKEAYEDIRSTAENGGSYIIIERLAYIYDEDAMERLMKKFKPLSYCIGAVDKFVKQVLSDEFEANGFTVTHYDKGDYPEISLSNRYHDTKVAWEDPKERRKARKNESHSSSTANAEIG